MDEPGIPRERNGDDPSIGKMGSEVLVSYIHPDHERFGLKM